MKEPGKLYLEKKNTKSGKEVFYIKERTIESPDPVIICLCQSELMAKRVLVALQGGQKRSVKP